MTVREKEIERKRERYRDRRQTVRKLDKYGKKRTRKKKGEGGRRKKINALLEKRDGEKERRGEREREEREREKRKRRERAR